MTMQQSGCPKCGGALEPGFALEHTTTNLMTKAVVQQTWHSGTPVLNRSGGIDSKRTSLGKGLPITMYRCSDCGYLDLFARPRPKW